MSLMGTSLATADDLKPEQIYEQLLPSVMTLQVENRAGERYVGTAFFAIEEGIAVTAWHVISDARKVTAKLPNGKMVDVLGVVDKDEKSDLALIKLPLTERPLAQFGENYAAVGSRAYVIGSPKGYDFSITDGLISQIQRVDGVRQYQVSCPISGGNSGGPLVNERGEVIGVTSWSKIDAQNLNFATPVEYLKKLDPGREVESWSAAGKSQRAKAKAAQPQPVGAVHSGNSDESFDRFNEFLKNSAGEEVTIEVRRNGSRKTFQFVVPEDSADR